MRTTHTHTYFELVIPGTAGVCPCITSHKLSPSTTPFPLLPGTLHRQSALTSMRADLVLATSNTGIQRSPTPTNYAFWWG